MNYMPFFYCHQVMTTKRAEKKKTLCLTLLRNRCNIIHNIPPLFWNGYSQIASTLRNFLQALYEKSPFSGIDIHKFRIHLGIFFKHFTKNPPLFQNRYSQIPNNTLRNFLQALHKKSSSFLEWNPFTNGYSQNFEYMSEFSSSASRRKKFLIAVPHQVMI